MATILTTLSDPTRLAAVRATRLMDEPSAPTLDRLTELGALTLGLPVVAITLLDDRRQFFASHIALGPDDGHETPLSHSLCQHVVHTGTPLVVGDAAQDPVLARNGAVRELGVRAYAGLPLLVDGQVLGSFCSLDTAPRSWTTHELLVLTRLAALAADYLALRARGTESEPASHALDASVLRRLPDTAVLRFDVDLRLSLAEGPALRRRDRGAERLVGRPIGEVLPADASSARVAWYDAVASGDHVSFDYATPTGAVWWCQGAPLLDDALQPAGGTVVIRDVTEQREHERVLEEREAQYRLLAERSTDVISRHDPTGRYLYASPAAGALYGYDPVSLVGRCATELIHPDDLAATAADLARLPSLEEGVGTNTYRLVRADGTVIWAETTASVVRDEHGAVEEIQCSTRDITDRRAAEDARRAADALTDTLLDALQEGVVVHGADGLILACNASAERILGLPREDLRSVSAFAPPWGMVDAAEQPLLPGDRPVQRVLETGEPQLGILVGLHRSDGRRVWLRVNAVPVRDDGGVLAQVLVSLSDITDLREAERRARHDADHDALTGLPNRALLRRRLDLILGAPRRRSGGDVAVLFVDLDEFKVVNDSLGHRAGDDVLRAVAGRLTGALRAGDMLARFGGDEFVVVAADVHGREGAEQLADRLLDVLKEPLRAGDVEHVVSASIGITVAVDRRAGGEALLRDADSAMYHAKQMGRSGFRLFEAEMHERAVQQLSLERDLRRALAEDQLEVHYQPLWRTTPRILVGLEALVRWRHPERGLMSPAAFIPVAERSGLIVELGDWVLEATCRQIADWSATQPQPPPPVSVNLSARQLDDPRVAERLAAVLRRHGVAAEYLTLELTESHLMSRADRPDGGLSALRALGVRLALDDFGTGYSSLSQLRDLPLDSLKIDQSFIARICTDDVDHAIVEAIVAMASALALEVVAEGVETEEQVQLLTRMGCDVLQGYALGRPQPAGGLEDLLRGARRAPRLQAARRAPPPTH